jgi:starch phosphorylase
MKFMMNRALTIGTLDGANIEIREEAGAENFFLLGLTAEEVAHRKREGYDPMLDYQTNPDLLAVLDLIRNGFFSRGDDALFRTLVEHLLHQDPYMLCADFQSYVDCQTAVDEAYFDIEHRTRMSIPNTARSGQFSSDRSIREYCEAIWRVKPVPIDGETRLSRIKSCQG